MRWTYRARRHPGKAYALATHRLALLALLSGCSGTEIGSRSTAHPEIARTTWALREFSGEPVVQTGLEPATLSFMKDGGVTGSSACNRAGGEELTWTATRSGREGTFSRNPLAPMITTAVGCGDDAAMQLGNDFWSRMSHARVWSARGGSLSISFSDGSTARLVRVRVANGS